MDKNQVESQNSDIIFDTPNDDISQVVEESKTIPQAEEEFDIGDGPTDLDIVETIENQSDSEKEVSHYGEDEELNADKIEHEEHLSESDESEGKLKEDEQGELEDENLDPSENVEAPSKLFKLPTSRLKSIVKLNPSVHMVNSEAIAVIGKATEMFLKELVSESYQVTRESGKKTLTMAHIEGVIQTLPQFEFLDGMLN